MNPTIMTAAGRYFNILDPDSSVVSIEEIAHALSNLCRYTGHVREFYSVAQHSVNVSWLVPREHALAGLLHDAAEAFIGDVSSPLKQLLPEYKAIEAKVEASIFRRFGLPAHLHPSVKHADLVMLATEKRDLMPLAAQRSEWECLEGITPRVAGVTPAAPFMARQMFLERFNELTSRRYA